MSHTATKQQDQQTDWRADPARRFELDKRLLAFVAKENGRWEPKALKQYRTLMERRGFDLDDEEFQRRLDRAVEQFRSGRSHVYLCICEPCCDDMNFDFSDEALEKIERESGCRVSTTWCLWRCGDSPVATVREGDRSQMFAKFPNPSDWKRIIGYARRCRSAGCLLQDAREAQPYWFTPPPPKKK